jgi:hypothetical protein
MNHTTVLPYHDKSHIAVSEISSSDGMPVTKATITRSNCSSTRCSAKSSIVYLQSVKKTFRCNSSMTC